MEEVITGDDYEFIRQQWRMWIETGMEEVITGDDYEFIRQQWRMWIETATATVMDEAEGTNSFASNGECGLKRSKR